MLAKDASESSHPLNNERTWLTPAYQPPGDTNVAEVQEEINSICGLTRNNKPIALLVWNGDIRYWKDVCVEWSAAGDPVRFIKRPIVLYRAVYGPHRQHIKDLFPPRWLVLTRIEPEQYVPTWERDSQVYDPLWGRRIQIRPATPPKEMYVWYATVAIHKAGCCARAEEERRICYGWYAPGRFVLDMLREARKGIDSLGIKDAPFDRPDRAAIKLRESWTTGYVEQALKTFDVQFSCLADACIGSGIKKIIRSAHQLALDELERKIKQAGA